MENWKLYDLYIVWHDCGMIVLLGYNIVNVEPILET